MATRQKDRQTGADVYKFNPAYQGTPGRPLVVIMVAGRPGELPALDPEILCQQHRKEYPIGPGQAIGFYPPPEAPLRVMRVMEGRMAHIVNLTAEPLTYTVAGQKKPGGFGEEFESVVGAGKAEELTLRKNEWFTLSLLP